MHTYSIVFASAEERFTFWCVRASYEAAEAYAEAYADECAAVCAQFPGQVFTCTIQQH